ncbi:hypothetical protein Tco_0796858 [Tanacetum coccineum]
MLRPDWILLSSWLRAAATLLAASACSTGGSHEADIPPSSSIPSDEFAGGSDVPAGNTTGPSADPSNKGKSPLLEEDPPVRERTFRQREEDRLGKEATRRMYDEEQDELEREREEIRRDFAAQRFQDKRNKPMTYAQQKAYMRTLVKNQSSTIYTTGWTMKHVKSFSDDQLKTEFDKIRTATADLQSQNIRRSLKRPGADLEQASSKKSKPTEASQSSIPDESQQPSAEVPPAATQQPSAFSSQPTIPSAEPRTHSYAEDRTIIRVLSDDSDDSNDDDDPPIFWPAFDAWEVVPTGLGDVNALYFMDKSSKYFTHLREILHLIDRKDLFKLYGMVVQYYEEHPLAGSGHQARINWGMVSIPSKMVCQSTMGVTLLVQGFPSPQANGYVVKAIKSIHGCQSSMDLTLSGPRLDADFLVVDSKFMKVAFGVGNHLTLIKGNQFDGRTKTDPHKHIHEFLRICDMFKCRDTKNEAVRLMMFPLSLTGEAKTRMDELNEGTIETWDEL